MWSVRDCFVTNILIVQIMQLSVAHAERARGIREYRPICVMPTRVLRKLENRLGGAMSILPVSCNIAQYCQLRFELPGAALRLCVYVFASRRESLDRTVVTAVPRRRWWSHNPSNLYAKCLAQLCENSAHLRTWNEQTVPRTHASQTVLMIMEA